MMASNVSRDWKQLGRSWGEAEFGLRSVRTEGLAGLNDLEFPINTRLSLIVGANGAGKTTLLKSIWAALDPERATGLPPFSGVVHLEHVFDGKLTSRQISILNGAPEHVEGEAPKCTHIDAAAESRKYKEQFCQWGQVEEIIEGAGETTLDGARLSEVKYLARRDYSEVRFSEVEIEPDVWAPFFQVRYGGTPYDSRTMGAGELSALHLWWGVDRCETSQYMLVEEPEALLSHGCQEAVGNFLARKTIEKKLCSIVSTHSIPIISSASDACALMLVRGAHGVSVDVGELKPAGLETLGVEFPWLAYLFVEDLLAKEACVRILRKFSPKLARTCWVEIRSGAGEIGKSLKLLDTIEGPIKFVGVLDGDIDLKEYESKGLPVFSLPGVDPIEVQLKVLFDKRLDDVSRALGVEGLSAVLAGIEGLDHHEWFERLAKELALSKTQLLASLFRFWVEDTKVQEDCCKLVSGLEEFVHEAG